MATRILQTRDLRLIYSMDRLCFEAGVDEEPPLTSSRWWRVTVDGHSVAYCGARYLLGEQAVYLSRAGVLPEYRGRGLQLAMVRARVRWARKVGARVVVTDTARSNPASSNTLIRAGFRLYLPEAPWREGCTLYWRLDL